VKLDYTLSLADYKAALSLHTRQRRSRRISQMFFIWSGPAITGLFFADVLISVLFARAKFTPSSTVTLACFALLLLVPVLHFWSVRRQFDLIVPPSMRNRTASVEMDNRRIIFTTPGLGEDEFFWNEVVGFAEDEKVAIVYARKRRFLFIPTQAFSPEQRAEFNELIARKVMKGSDADQTHNRLSRRARWPRR
jgi:YcxB-like protein